MSLNGNTYICSNFSLHQSQKQVVAFACGVLLVATILAYQLVVFVERVVVLVSVVVLSVAVFWQFDLQMDANFTSPSYIHV